LFHAATAIFAAVLLASPLAAGTAAPATTKGHPMHTTPSGLSYVDTVEGTGPAPKTGSTCVMHYTGWLNDGGKPGRKFDSSVDRGQTFEFQVGVGQVIKGWDEGVISMKKGGKRTLYIPSALGYGSRGAGGVIPPNADLIFDVELIDVR
jgi:peptidylprolyl isomerase